MPLPRDEGLPLAWFVEDPDSQGQVEESCWSVYSLQLDQLSVGIHRLFQEICLCLWTDCTGEHGSFSVESSLIIIST